MASYPALNKALVIDPSGELRDFMRFCAGRFWPGLQIVGYLWARGCPDESFEWSGYDLVVMEHRLHNEYCPGGDLRERIMRGISAQDALRYLTQIMRTCAETCTVQALFSTTC